MPYLINTPESWFRTKNSDLHLFRVRRSSRKHSKRTFKNVQSKLHVWFSIHLPDIKLTVIGPSEYSGYLLGGPCYLTADLNSEEIAMFNASWGEDSFWKIETWLYSDWLSRVESANLLPSPVVDLNKVRWWDTPGGFLLLDACTTGTFVCVEARDNILSREDSWWCLQQKFPEFNGLEADNYPCGYFMVNKRESCPAILVLEYVSKSFGGKWDADEYAKNTQKIQELKNAIGIPAEMETQIIVGDF